MEVLFLVVIGLIVLAFIFIKPDKEWSDNYEQQKRHQAATDVMRIKLPAMTVSGNFFHECFELPSVLQDENNSNIVMLCSAIMVDFIKDDNAAEELVKTNLSILYKKYNCINRATYKMIELILLPRVKMGCVTSNEMLNVLKKIKDKK